MALTTKHISALQGNPSTFWSNDDGKTWYRTKAEAEAGAGTVVNPDDYVYSKGFWAQNKKTILVCLAIAVVLGFGFFLYRKGTFALILKH